MNKSLFPTEAHLPAYAGKPSSLGPLLRPSSAHRSKTLAHPTVTKRPSREYNCTFHPNPGFLRALHLPPRRRLRRTQPHPPWVSTPSSPPPRRCSLVSPCRRAFARRLSVSLSDGLFVAQGRTSTCRSYGGGSSRT